jgi:hypothetical protein
MIEGLYASLLETPLGAINDPLLRQLFEELEAITRVRVADRLHETVNAFLFQSLYRNGSQQFVKLTKDEVDSLPLTGEVLLGKTLRKLDDTSVYRLCDELARRKGGSADRYWGTQLYSFLNKEFPNIAKKRKRR